MKKIQKLEKIEIFVQNWNFWSKNEIFGQNRNFDQKSKLRKSIEISMKNFFLVKNKIVPTVSQISVLKVLRNFTKKFYDELFWRKFPNVFVRNLPQICQRVDQ